MNQLPRSRAGISLAIFGVLVAPLIVGSLLGILAGVPAFWFVLVGALAAVYFFWTATYVGGCALGGGIVAGLGLLMAVAYGMGCCDIDNDGLFWAFLSFLVAIPCFIVLFAVSSRRVAPPASDDGP